MELSTFPAQRVGSELLVLEIKPPAQARPLPGPGWARGFSPIPFGKLCRCHLAKFRGFWHGVGHLWHIPELDLFPHFHLRGAPWPAEPGRRLILGPNSYFEGDDVRSPAA